MYDEHQVTENYRKPLTVGELKLALLDCSDDLEIRLQIPANVSAGREDYVAYELAAIQQGPALAGHKSIKNFLQLFAK